MGNTEFKPRQVAPSGYFSRTRRHEASLEVQFQQVLRRVGDDSQSEKWMGEEEVENWRDALLKS